jgi:hypothetical protein
MGAKVAKVGLSVVQVMTTLGANGERPTGTC